MRPGSSHLWATVCVLVLLSSTGARAEAEGLKLFISVDMEGVVGVVTADHLGPDGVEYQRAREWMTGELLAEEPPTPGPDSGGTVGTIRAWPIIRSSA